MFQTFDERSSPAAAAARIGRLREEMRREGLDAFLVPHADEHQSEYPPADAERLAWLTGFTGSAGFCIVTPDRAVLFVDGRYTLQARAQTDPGLIEIDNLIDHPPSAWLEANATAGMKVGFDPWLVTIEQKKRFTRALAKRDAALVPAANLIDRIWTDRPARPSGRVSLHPIEFAGRPAPEKLDELSRAVAEAGADHCVLTDPASVAWAFNIRGDDVRHIPVALAFALISAEGQPVLFIDAAKPDDAARAALGAICRLADPATLLGEIAGIAHGRKFLCDRALVASAIERCIADHGGIVVAGDDPVAMRRAVKNEAEIVGMRAAHLRDGVAVSRFLAWLDRQPPGILDEIGAAVRLEAIRAETAAQMNSELKDLSFDTISAAGAHGAIVHYRVTTATNAPLAADTLYLVDSGAQFVDGTTDITRTVAIGRPPAGAREDFTLVLKGHIAIANARFPQGTRGIDIDAFARRPLWDRGRDYAHGTGHGIGAYLSVHEGPASISRRGLVALKAGMILSNEPGFYREGAYGIRIENLVLVRDCADFERFLEFETLTLAPIDRRLIDAGLLSPDEVAWLDAYHARVRTALSAHLDENDRAWLAAACAPLAAGFTIRAP
ncbi:MAG: Xaa-Pro aminopeptidase [Alphaproteobacteria bacterium]|nr:MAG: Xaa-Pro aminopeptidase [Alphaproteobacteria bacterium]